MIMLPLGNQPVNTVLNSSFKANW